jgi:hypothetical protein
MAHRPIPCKMAGVPMKARDAERLGVVPGYDLAALRNSQCEFRLWGSRRIAAWMPGAKPSWSEVGQDLVKTLGVTQSI